MPIIKAELTTKFTIMSNETMQDKTLSFEATGLLAMLLTLPVDWVVHKSWLKEQKVKCGRDKLTTLLNELKEAGYVTKTVKQGADGKMQGVDWLVYPTNEPRIRATDNPSNGVPATTKKPSIQSKQDTNTNSVIDQLFEQFWLAGMVKVNKKKALTVFRAKIKNESDKEAFRTLLVDDVTYRLYMKQFGFDKMHPVTYLNGERWTDDHQTNSSPVNNINESKPGWSAGTFDPNFLES